MNALTRCFFYFGLFLFCTPFFLLSCQSDDDSDDGSVVGIVDAWIATEVRTALCDSGITEIQFTEANPCTTIVVEECYALRYTFTPDGNLFIAFSLTIESGGQSTTQTATSLNKYSVDGNTLTICDAMGDNCNSSPFTLVDDMLSTTYQNPDNNCQTLLRARRE